MQLTTIRSRLRSLPSIVLFLTALGVTTANAQVPEQTLTPMDDSFTHSGAPRVDYSTRESMRTANRSSGVRTSFVDFNWSLVTGNVTSATLRLFVDSLRKEGALQVSPVLGNWFESGIRFNNQPGIGAPAASIAISEADERGYLEIDVTAIVRAFQGNTPPPNGFALVSDGGLDTSFATSESDNPPQLVLMTDDDPINTEPVVDILVPFEGSSFIEGDTIRFAGEAMDAQDGNLSSSLTWTSDLDGLLANTSFFTALLSPGTHTITASVTDSGGMTGTNTVSVRVDPAGDVVMETRRVLADAFIFEGAPSANFSRRKSMRVATSSSGERISFVAPELGLSRNVVSATLRLFVDDVKREGTVQVSSVAETWFDTELRWNNQPAINPPGASIDITSANEGTYVEIDVTSIYQGFQVLMPPPRGLALKSGGDVDVNFATRESANQPQLVLMTDGSPINAPPSVTATVRQFGDLEGDPVTFTGTATDALDGDLSSSLTWTSDRDGLIGMGASFTTTTLSVGRHIVTASVTDSGGLSASRTLVFGVRTDSPVPDFRRMLHDSFTHEGAPNSNFSARRTMRVANRSSGERVSFIQPDLTGVTRPVTSAVFRLFVDDINRGGAVQVSSVAGSWDEATITWNNQPSINLPETTTAITVADNGSFVDIDVTPIIQQYQANTSMPFFGVALRSINDLDVTFLTDERDRDSGGLFLFYD
ncbi:MAG: DNRLRE domain-containing protein [Pseudomonadota bacterium]